MEEWRDAPGCEGYQVSSEGRVASCERTILRSNGYPQTICRRLLKAGPYAGPHRGNRYAKVSVNRAKKAVHLLVAEAFHGPRPDGMVCDHINGDRTDNRSANLRWTTPKINGIPSVVVNSKPCTMRKGQVTYFATSRTEMATLIGADQANLSNALAKGNTTYRGWRAL